MIKYLVSILLILPTFLLTAQVDSAKIYWVGHSLISHTDAYNPGTVDLILLMDTMATSQSKGYDFHDHTIPGAPFGWNWGTPSSWAEVEPIIAPLTDPADPEYGTFTAIVLTEAINIESYWLWWWCDFYARKFYNAALDAREDTKLYLYESWHHYNAGDDDFRDYYGPMSLFDWKQYMLDVRPVWEDIMDQAADPALTRDDPDYVYQGSGADPGLGDDTLEIYIIPVGQVLIEVLDRLESMLPGDDWTYKGSVLEDVDFFANPCSDFPADTVTVVHPGDPLDDVHPSNVLIYLNSLTHYAVIYRDNPKDIPPSNGVPANVADIFKEVVWDVVVRDPRTGLGTSKWVGKTDSNWDKKSNWEGRFIPDSSSHVIIPSGVDFNPIININDTIGKMTLEDNAQLEIMNNVRLDIIAK